MKTLNKKELINRKELARFGSAEIEIDSYDELYSLLTNIKSTATPFFVW